MLSYCSISSICSLPLPHFRDLLFALLQLIHYHQQKLITDQDVRAEHHSLDIAQILSK